MFDIHEYYIGEPGGSLDAIESQLTDEIEALVNTSSTLYTIDRFKKRELNISILTPALDYPNGRLDYTDAETIRFQLSIFPEIEKISSVQTVIIRPRHIECAGVELVALYIPVKKTIVLYLHCPHNYTFENYRYNVKSEPYNLATIVDPSERGAGISDKKGADLPPLLYVLSMISHHNGDDTSIDKFLFRTDTFPDQKMPVLLDEISLFYSKNGY